MLNAPKNDNKLLNMRSEERLGPFCIAKSLIITISPLINLLEKGNAMYESNIFETK